MCCCALWERCEFQLFPEKMFRNLGLDTPTTLLYSMEPFLVDKVQGYKEAGSLSADRFTTFWSFCGFVSVCVRCICRGCGCGCGGCGCGILSSQCITAIPGHASIHLHACPTVGGCLTCKCKTLTKITSSSFRLKAPILLWFPGQ